MKTNQRLRVILDTNAVLSATHIRSPFRIVLDALFDDQYDIFVTNDILLEYEEKLTTNFDREVADLIVDAMSLLNNVKKIDTFFQLQLIPNDPDDNKFVDTAFMSNAHFIVTNDRHFNVLKNIDFPKITVIKVEEFVELLKENYSSV